MSASPVRQSRTRRAALSRALAPVLAAGLALAGCSRGGDDPLKDVPAFSVDEARVTLLDAGRDPRELAFAEPDGVDRQTRVAVSHGIAQDIVAADKVATRAPAGGDVDTTTVPLTIRTTTPTAPGSGEQDADRAVSFTAGAPEFSDLAAGTDATAAEGFRMSWRTAHSGAVSTVKLLAPEKAPEQARESVESALLTVMSTNVVFPAQPVGEGGAWTVESRITGDAPMVRTTTYTVERIDGDTVTLGVEVQERPTEQSVDIDSTAAGAVNGHTLRVENSSTTSEGAIDVDLGSAVPVGGHVNATTRIIYAGPEGDNRVVQDITTAVAYGT